MPIISITQMVDALYEYLMNCFKDYCGLAAKDNETPSDGNFRNVPYMYKYLMPSVDLCDCYPTKSPCVVITIDSQEDPHTYNLSLHLCVKYDVIAESEKATPVPGAKGLYEFHTESGDYVTGADVELYKTCILYTELLTDMLHKSNSVHISDVIAEMPDPSLPDYPYCISTIRFKTIVNAFSVNQKSFDDFY